MVQTSSPILLYVNPTSGNDTASGTQSAPFKTLTRATQQASAGTTIRLVPGTYSATSGELFQTMNLPLTRAMLRRPRLALVIAALRLNGCN